jgi:excisionase family DNA binding protein
MLVSVREACATLAVSRTTLWRLVNDGRVPRPVQVSPGRVAFRAEELQAFVAALPRAGER